MADPLDAVLQSDAPTPAAPTSGDGGGSSGSTRLRRRIFPASKAKAEIRANRSNLQLRTKSEMPPPPPDPRTKASENEYLAAWIGSRRSTQHPIHEAKKTPRQPSHPPPKEAYQQLQKHSGTPEGRKPPIGSHPGTEALADSHAVENRNSHEATSQGNYGTIVRTEVQEIRARSQAEDDSRREAYRKALQTNKETNRSTLHGEPTTRCTHCNRQESC